MKVWKKFEMSVLKFYTAKEMHLENLFYKELLNLKVGEVKEQNIESKPQVDWDWERINVLFYVWYGHQKLFQENY